MIDVELTNKQIIERIQKLEEIISNKIVGIKFTVFDKGLACDIDKDNNIINYIFGALEENVRTK